jgi:hypothetical protein
MKNELDMEHYRETYYIERDIERYSRFMIWYIDDGLGWIDHTCNGQPCFKMTILVIEGDISSTKEKALTKEGSMEK